MGGVEMRDFVSVIWFGLSDYSSNFLFYYYNITLCSSPCS